MSEQPQDAPEEPIEDDLPEQMRVRRDKRDRLVAEGVQPYPVTVARISASVWVRSTVTG